VEQAVLHLAEEDANFHVVDMSDCKLGSDNLHFDATGCLDAAQRMFEKLVSLGLLEDDETGVETIKNEELIIKNDVVYDLQGRRIVNSKSSNCNLKGGIYIKGNRKIIRTTD
jgi:hypothetical protein